MENPLLLDMIGRVYFRKQIWIGIHFTCISQERKRERKKERKQVLKKDELRFVHHATAMLQNATPMHGNAKEHSLSGIMLPISNSNSTA